MDIKTKNAIINEYKKRFPKRKFIPSQTAAPVSGKVFNEREILMMVEAVLDGHWTEGRFCKKFEEELAEFLGVKFCSMVNSGSSANLLALSAMTSFRLPPERRLKKGDEVVATAASFPTTVNPIIQNSLIPVFVDIDLGTYNINIKNLEKAISKKTKAIFIAHTLGNPFNLDEIMKLRKKYNLWLIEDNCDALGSKYKGKYTGSFGDISTLSFYPAHHITTGEGGAILTSNPLLYKIVRSMRDWGRDCWCPTGRDNTCGKRFEWKLGDLPKGYDHKYIYSEIGYNLKSTDLQGALGLAQMGKLPDFIKKREENFDYLYNAFKKFEKYFILPQWEKNAQPSWFGFLLTLKDSAKFSREDLLKFLNERKIATRLLFAGNITKQPYFTDRNVGDVGNVNYRIAGDLKNTNYIMNNTFWLGVYPGLDKEMLKYIIKGFEEFLKNV